MNWKHFSSYLLLFFCLLFNTSHLDSFSNNRFYFSSDTYYTDLKEKMGITAESTEEGFVPGYMAGYNRQSPGSIYLGFDIRRNKATTSQKDNTLDQKPKNSLANYEGRLGISMGMQNSFLVTPFVGIGKHVWKRKVHEPEKGREEVKYNWDYLSYGIRLLAQLSDSFDVGFHVKLIQLLHGKIRVSGEDFTYFSEVFPGSSHLSFDTKNIFQYELEAPFYLHFAPIRPFDLTIVPYYRDLTIKKGKNNSSQFDHTLYGPSNESYEIGLRVEVGLNL